MKTTLLTLIAIFSICSVGHAHVGSHEQAAHTHNWLLVGAVIAAMVIVASIKMAVSAAKKRKTTQSVSDKRMKTLAR